VTDGRLAMMWWWGPGEGTMGAAGWIGFVLMVVFWVLVVVGVVFLIRSLVRATWWRGGESAGGMSYGPSSHGADGVRPWMRNLDALRILDERYARGEIDREEYLQKRADLLGDLGGDRPT
jgi:putative membrane protein